MTLTTAFNILYLSQNTGKPTDLSTKFSNVVDKSVLRQTRVSLSPV